MDHKARIAILTYGSRGDVEPFVALGVGLRRIGHPVRLAAPAPFAALVESHGLGFQPIEGDPYELTQAFADRAGLSWPRMVIRMIEHVRPLAQRALGALASAAEDADLIVHSFLMTDAGHTLARAHRVPDVSAQFFPVFLPSSGFSAVALPDLPLGPAYRRVTHFFSTAVFRYGSRLLYALVRASAPDLPALAPWPFGRASGNTTPILFAYSRHVLARPANWPSWAHVTGYWRLAPDDWLPPAALADFLESGSPPIYFGPGSVRTEILDRLLRAVISSARAHGQRAFLGVPPQLLDAEMRGDDVFAAEGLPHSWLFPRMRFILHHGGAGTTAAAAAAGIPSSAIPFSADQAFWARRIHRLGVGPAAPPARGLTRKHMDAILEDALENSAYALRARILGEKLRQEDGVATAIQVLQAELGAP